MEPLLHDLMEKQKGKMNAWKGDLSAVIWCNRSEVSGIQFTHNSKPEWGLLGLWLKVLCKASQLWFIFVL